MVHSLDPCRIRLYIWFPKYVIDIRDQHTLQRCFYLNGVNGKVPCTEKGKHKLMGHTMVHLEGNPLPRVQEYFGKTSPDGEVEKAWAASMRLDFGFIESLWYGAVTNVLGIVPRFDTPEAPERGVRALFDARNLARYETEESFRNTRERAHVVWAKDIPTECARSALDWIADSRIAPVDPRGAWYGFGSACSDWAVEVLESAGALTQSLRTTIFIHEDFWDRPGEMERPAWCRSQTGPYTRPVEILTPTLLDEAMKREPDWECERRTRAPLPAIEAPRIAQNAQNSQNR